MMDHSIRLVAPVELGDLELDAVAGGFHREAIQQVRTAARGEWTAWAAALTAAVQEAVDEIDPDDISEANVVVSVSIAGRQYRS